MATAHVTRGRGARSAQARFTPKTSRKPPRAHRPHASELSVQLAQIVLRLKLLYSTCVTVRLALKAQNAEQDEDMARCLMWQVAEPLSVQVQALQGIAEGLKRGSVSRPLVRP
jgi:hypothetical protein